ncbi:helix-turn-helix transcriptional regulator [Paenibacillus oryzisoli]|uniref:helix-turn-helix domain-containing protein n=1 Tax=Paenibacillus oryzisoli TaxID=1850517 RepID=UPI003D272237
MGNLRNLIGKQIRMIRKQRGLSQEKLGELAQLKNSYIGDVERGARNISLDSLEKIITALETDLGTFFKFSEIDIASNDVDKQESLEVHTQFLQDRTNDEIKLIHKITRDILNGK